MIITILLIGVWHLQTADCRPQTADHRLQTGLTRKILLTVTSSSTTFPAQNNINPWSELFWRKSISWKKYYNLLLQIVVKDWKRVMVLTLFTVSDVLSWWIPGETSEGQGPCSTHWFHLCLWFLSLHLPITNRTPKPSQKMFKELYKLLTR